AHPPQQRRCLWRVQAGRSRPPAPPSPRTGLPVGCVRRIRRPPCQQRVADDEEDATADERATSWTVLLSLPPYVRFSAVVDMPGHSSPSSRIAFGGGLRRWSRGQSRRLEVDSVTFG